jgi:hypothetical protein
MRLLAVNDVGRPSFGGDGHDDGFPFGHGRPGKEKACRKKHRQKAEADDFE